MLGKEVVLLLGGDLGDPAYTLNRAEETIALRIGAVVARSRDHWTEPWGFQADTLFLNRALLLRTELDPQALMQACLEVEKNLGRVRSEVPGTASRLIDIDVLAIGQEVLLTETLVVPHPRLHLRRFALAPLCDVLPGWRHPVLDRSALDLLNALPPA